MKTSLTVLCCCTFTIQTSLTCEFESLCSPVVLQPDRRNLPLVVVPTGIERLLLLLGEKPSSSSPSEGAACERVQQKAAVTLARLSRDNDVAHTAIQLKGGAVAFIRFLQRFD